MGLFSSKESCFICGKTGDVKISDGTICFWCRDKCEGYLYGITYKPKLFTKQQALDAVEHRKKDYESISIFKETRSVPNRLCIDETNKMWYIPQETRIKPPIIRKFEDIIKFELQENGKTVSKSGLGSAIIGGALFGSAGAVVGAVVGKKEKEIVNTVQVHITVNDSLKPLVIIHLLPSSTKKDSIVYKKAMTEGQDILNLLAVMTEQVNNEPNSNATAPISVADEIKKFKELLDMGAITQEEFDTKKKELLG